MIMKRILLPLFMLLLPLMASAYETVNIDGLYYELMQFDGVNYATLKASPDKYSGSITVPEQIWYEGEEYMLMDVSYDAFIGCPELTSVYIANKTLGFVIDYEPTYSPCIWFKDSPKLESIEVTEDNPYIDSRNHCNAVINSVTGKLIGGCKNTVIPEGVTSIDSYAFTGCDIASVVFPEGVEQIGSDAFRRCKQLKSVTLPSTLKSINGGAFRDCEQLKSVYLSDIASWCNVTINEKTDYASHSKASPFSYGAMLYLNGKLVEDLVIPEGVTSISDFAFLYCSNNFKSITIPSSLQTVGKGAFDYIRDADFQVRISDLAAWCSITFMETMTISYGYISNPLANAHLVLNGEEITDLVIPESVEIINDYAFCYTKHLNSVTIPDGVTRIGKGAFYFSGIQGTLKIPNSVTTIDDNAFNECHFTTIELGTGIKYLGNTCLDNYILKDLYYYASSLPETSEIPIKNWGTMKNGKWISNFSKATLHIMESLIEEAKVTAPWSLFGFFDPLPATGIKGVAADSPSYEIYSIDGRCQSSMTKGINIVKYSDGTTKKVWMR